MSATTGGLGDTQVAVRARSDRWGRLLWQGASAGGTAVVMLVVYVWNHQSFLVDDKRNQYLPVMMDIGRRLRAGEWLPLIDPNLGNGGNYSLDVHYRIFEPTHWVVAIGLSHFTDLQLAAFVWSLVFEVVLALGTTALVCRAVNSWDKL